MNKKLEEFKKYCSEFNEHFLNVHNYKKQFIENISNESGKQIRTSLSKMEELCRYMRKASLEAYTEHRTNNEAEIRRLKERRRRAKQRIMPTGRPKGRKNGISTTNQANS